MSRRLRSLSEEEIDAEVERLKPVLMQSESLLHSTAITEDDYVAAIHSQLGITTPVILMWILRPLLWAAIKRLARWLYNRRRTRSEIVCRYNWGEE